MPTEIQYVTGDAASPRRALPRAIIVHVCNDVGAWGAGFTRALSRRWAAPEAEYRAWHARGEARLGAVRYVPVEPGVIVACLVGQHGLISDDGPPPVRYDAIRTGLFDVARWASAIGAGVHMPRIGCGLAGGAWEHVEPIVREELADVGVPVTVYDLPAATNG